MKEYLAELEADYAQKLKAAQDAAETYNSRQNIIAASQQEQAGDFLILTELKGGLRELQAQILRVKAYIPAETPAPAPNTDTVSPSPAFDTQDGLESHG